MLKFEKRMEKTMEPDFSQNEPKLVLTYPHKSKFNTIGLLSMAASSFVVLGLLKHPFGYIYYRNSTDCCSARYMVYRILYIHQWNETGDL